MIKALLVLYIISTPVVGSIPIQYYVAHSSFVCIYIVSSLIIGVLYDVVICLLLVVILLTWMYSKQNVVTAATAATPRDYVVPDVEKEVPRVVTQEHHPPVSTEDFTGYDTHRDSFASFEEF